MASNVSLGGVDLPDGIDRTNGEGHVYWSDRDDYNPVIMQWQQSLGGRFFYNQTTQSGGRPITLEFTDRAWLFETAKDALVALYVARGLQVLSWYGESYQTLFDSEDGPACSFQPLQIGRGLSQIHWAGVIRLVTAK